MCLWEKGTTTKLIYRLSNIPANCLHWLFFCISLSFFTLLLFSSPYLLSTLAPLSPTPFFWGESSFPLIVVHIHIFCVSFSWLSSIVLDNLFSIVEWNFRFGCEKIYATLWIMIYSCLINNNDNKGTEKRKHLFAMADAATIFNQDNLFWDANYMPYTRKQHQQCHGPLRHHVIGINIVWVSVKFEFSPVQHSHKSYGRIRSGEVLCFCVDRRFSGILIPWPPFISRPFIHNNLL